MFRNFFFVLNSVLVLISLWNLIHASKLFDDAVTEATHEDVLREWRKMEDSMIWGNEKLASWLEPHLDKLKLLNITSSCTESLLRSYNGLKNNKVWAIQLLDSIGKPITGILRNPTTFGSFYGCLNLKVPTVEEEMLNKTLNVFNFQHYYEDIAFMGRYCLIDIRPTLPKRDRFVYNYKIPHPFGNMSGKNELMQHIFKSVGHAYEIPMRAGLCLPDKCSSEDVQKVVFIITAYSEFLHISLHSCQDRFTISPALETHQILIICAMSFVALVCTLATALDYKIYDSGRENKESSVEGAENAMFSAKQFIYIFSVRQNMRLILSSKGHADTKLSCLRGLRFMAFSWVFIGQLVQSVDPFFIRNPDNLRRVYKDLLTQVFMNTWAPIDLFFFISATLVSYIVVTGVDSKRTALNVPKMILKRIWRLLPGELLVTGLMFLLHNVNNGPLWEDFFGPATITCKNTWWSIFTFGQNFMNPNDTCLIHLWYVAVDFQYLIIAIIYLVILFKNKSMANIFLVICIGFSVGFGTYLSYANQLPPALFPIYSNVPAMLEYAFFNHYLPHAHLCAYAIGLGTGTFLARTERFNLSKPTLIFGWLHNTICALFVCYGTYLWANGREPSLAEGLSYTALHHIAWCFAINWLVVMCATGNCGFLNWFLSWRVFVIFNRPSYMMYLFHYLVLQYFFKSMQGEQDFSYKIMTFWHCSNIIATYLGAVTLCVFFDYPCQKLGTICLNTWFGERLSVKNKDPPTPPVGEINVVFNMNEINEFNNNQKNLEK